MPNICRNSFFIILFFVACKSSSNNSIQFTGITSRDANGAPSGSVDSSDWNFTDNWKAQESNLFSNHYATNCPAGTYSVSAFPNPCNGVFYLSFTSDTSYKINIRIVDQDFHVLLSRDSLKDNMTAIDASGYSPGLFRVYYQVVKGGCEFRGHGDIKKQ